MDTEQKKQKAIKNDGKSGSDQDFLVRFMNKIQTSKLKNNLKKAFMEKPENGYFQEPPCNKYNLGG